MYIQIGVYDTPQVVFNIYIYIYNRNSAFTYVLNFRSFKELVSKSTSLPLEAYHLS